MRPQKDEYTRGFASPTREVLLNGRKVHYDACSTDTTLEKAKSLYPAFTYIGTSKVYYINGTKNESDYEIHFFIKKNINEL